MKFAVGGIFKNEDDYLLEWLAFHKVVGFTHFLIADNGSTDLTHRILSILEPHESITVINYPDTPGVRPQLGAYVALAKACPKHIDAVAFIDADEFVFPMQGQKSAVPELTKLFSDPTVSGVALNWACFGSGGDTFWEEGLVVERFVNRAKINFSVNQHYKVVVRPEQVVSWNTPHHAKLASGRYVDVLGNDLVFRDGFSDSLSKEVTWGSLRLNHYIVKSLEEFLVRKSPKGSASKEGRIKHKKYFLSHDKNDERCEEMREFVPAVKREYERLETIVRPELERLSAVDSSVWRQWASNIKSALKRD